MKKIITHLHVSLIIHLTISSLMVSCVKSLDNHDNQNTDKNTLSSTIPIEFIGNPLFPESELFRPNESLFIKADRTFTYTRKENVNHATVEQIEIQGKLNNDNTVTFDNENKYQFKNGLYVKPAEMLSRWSLDTIYGFLPVISLYRKSFNTTTWNYQESPIFFHPKRKITVGTNQNSNPQRSETNKIEVGKLKGSPFSR
jgi:hypothetical protein